MKDAGRNDGRTLWRVGDPPGPTTSPRPRLVRGERVARDLVHALDVLTAALNDVRTRNGHGLGGSVRWLLPKVVEERNRLADELALRRAQ